MLSVDKNVGGFLERAFAEGRVGHAYIVVGEKQYLSGLLAECAMVVLNPAHKVDDGEVCHRIATGQHPDVISLPTDKVKSRISVADINLLVEESYKCPVDVSSGARVFLVDGSASVTGIGSDVWQNKLLKTLEEPTDGVFIFVGVTDLEGLLPTVRSRCQVLKRTHSTVAEVCDALHADGFDKRSCQIAAALSGGSVNEGRLILNDPDTFAACQAAIRFATQMTSTKNALAYVAPVVQAKNKVNEFLTFLQLLYRESIVSRVNGQLCLLTELRDEVRTISDNYTIDACRAAIEKIFSAKRALDGSANLQVTIDDLASAISEVKFRCRQ